MIGFIVAAALYYFNLTYQWVVLQPIDYIFLVGITLFYAGAADCDQPGSLHNKYFVTFLGIFAIYALLNGYQTAAIIAIGIIVALKHIHHRTIMHSVVGGIIMAVPLYFIQPWYMAFAVIIHLSHILIDGEFSIFHEADSNYPFNKILRR